MPYKQFLGYEKGENGIPVINEEEAETVRLIYKMFLEGKTTQGIANFLMDCDILSPAGKKTWSSSTVASIPYERIVPERRVRWPEADMERRSGRKNIYSRLSNIFTKKPYSYRRMRPFSRQIPIYCSNTQS